MEARQSVQGGLRYYVHRDHALQHFSLASLFLDATILAMSEPWIVSKVAYRLPPYEDIQD